MTAGRPVRRPRVAHVVPAPEFVSLIMVHDLRRLVETLDPTVICSEGPGVAALRAEGLRVLTIPMRRKLTPFADLAAAIRLWRLFRAERFDIVQGYTPKGGLLVALAGAAARVPLRIYSCRGLLYTAAMSSSRRALFRTTDRVTASLTHCTFFISRADAQYAVAERLWPEEKARFVGSGIDLSRFDATALPADTRARLRAELGIPANAPMILTVARFVAAKGYEELAEAAAIVLRERPDARFVWVAPAFTDEEGVLPDSLMARYGVAHAVVRLGHRDDIPALYSAADVMTLPSHREGVSRVLMEAAAVGVGIVASDVSGCREVVGDDEAGWLVPVGDATALARALLHAVNDPAERGRRARHARDDVRARYSLDALAGRLRAAYKELMVAHPAIAGTVR